MSSAGSSNDNIKFDMTGANGNSHNGSIISSSNSIKKKKKYEYNSYDKEYDDSVQNYRNSKISSDPGYFAKSREQIHYELCLACPFPRRPMKLQKYTTASTSSNNGNSKNKNNNKNKPVRLVVSVVVVNELKLSTIVLPLRIHLIRSGVLGCSNSLNGESVRDVILKRINKFWKQAGIEFNLIDVADRPCSSSRLNRETQLDIQHFIHHKLKRGQNGQMMHKKERRVKFCDVLLSSFGSDCYSNKESSSSASDDDASFRYCYNIWFMDIVGDGSQGQCIDRKNRTIIMGERSTKGYDVPTKRPHRCLGKTAAHELGHALGLNHPKGMKFEDGKNQILSEGMNNERNLMVGGSDKNGGGGSHLEEWQISIAREFGKTFLRKLNTTSQAPTTSNNNKKLRAS